MKKWSFESKRDLLLYIFIIVLLIQTLLYVRVSESPYLFSDNMNQIKIDADQISETFIKDTIRAEQRRALVAIRQAWVQYLSTNPDVELLTEDNQWNEKVIKDIFSIIAEPLRLFSTNSNLMVTDINTGNILVAPMLTDEDKEKISLNGKPNVLMYYKLSGLHQSHTREIYNELLIKKDSDRNSLMTSLMSEPSQIRYADINNFTKYPLGRYNREFIEKIVLPYESIGVNGLDNMQLVVSIGVNESEIMKPYTQRMETLNSNFNELYTIAMNLKKGLQATIVVSVVAILACIIYIRILGHRSAE